MAVQFFTLIEKIMKQGDNIHLMAYHGSKSTLSYDRYLYEHLGRLLEAEECKAQLNVQMKSLEKFQAGLISYEKMIEQCRSGKKVFF